MGLTTLWNASIAFLLVAVLVRLWTIEVLVADTNGVVDALVEAVLVTCHSKNYDMKALEDIVTVAMENDANTRNELQAVVMFLKKLSENGEVQ